jgi:hypothetical protein
MNTYGRIYELLLEGAFLLEQRKPLSRKQKLGAGILGAAALFGAGKGMQRTSTAKATPTPVTAPAKEIKFKTDYERGSRMRSPLPKNPHGKVPSWVHTDDKGKAVREIPRGTRYGASQEFNRRNPDREKISRAITGKDPIMPKRTSGEIGPPAKPSFKAKMTKAVVSGYKQIKSASRAAQKHTSMASKIRGVLDKAKGLSKGGEYLGKKIQQGDLHLVSKGLVPPPHFQPKGISDKPPVELLNKQKGPKKISALSKGAGKTDRGKTAYPHLTISTGGQMTPTSELPKDKPSILDPGSKAQRAYLKYKDKPKKKK